MGSLQRAARFLHQRVGLLLLMLLLCEITAKDNLDVCKALNIFGRYGYYSISMRVTPRSDYREPWIFREPIVDVFLNNSEILRVTNEKNITFHGEFHMEFCENLDQLMEAYFREFKIELMDKPWHAFTAGWSEGTIAKNFGIEVSYVKNPMSYILVRILRRREGKKLKNTLTNENAYPLPHVQQVAESIKEGNKTSVENFFRKYGSHYISSFTTGNALYQVFVYHPPVYRRLKARINRIGISSLKKNQIYTFFSPWYAEHVGLVLPTSGNITLMNWATSVLTSRSHLFPYSSLMRLYGNINRLKELDDLLKNEALLSLELKTLAPIFNEPEKRNWFLEVLSNNILMWEFNL